MTADKFFPWLLMFLLAATFAGIVALAVTGLTEASHYPTQLLHGDVNCDGVVDIVDALVIAQYDALLDVPDFPGCPHVGEAIP